MMNRLSMTLFSILILVGGGANIRAGGPDIGDSLPSGLEPHLRGVSGGQVDWANGYIIAEGRGYAHGTTEQDRLMAQRAARVVAARNALAIALGLQIDDQGRFADVPGGEVRLRGVLKGHRTVSADWRPNATPPECRVKLKVPIWGAKGAASVVYTAQRSKAFAGRRRLSVTTTRRDVSDRVLIIDARGTGLTPCLFPVVVNTDGAVVYDVGTITHRQAGLSSPARFAETTLTYEKLQSALLAGQHGEQVSRANGHPAEWSATFPLNQTPNSFQSILCSWPPPKAESGLRPDRPASQPASRPTTRPAKKTRRRRRVVRAAQATGKSGTEIVLTKEDADRLRQSPEGASLLRTGQVIVVVDSVAAGIQGRHDDGPSDSILALGRGR